MKTDHPAHKLFKELEGNVVGVSCGCADVFGASPSGFDLIRENKVPSTSGLPSLYNIQKQGNHILTF